MNDKEIAELRRRLHPDRHNITHVFGCYVNTDREIISTFAQSMGLMPEDESEKYLALFKRSMSGTPSKNLLEITFRTAQVADSDEHRLLTTLNESALKDEEARQSLFEKIIASVTMDTNFVILLAHNTYDVPFRNKSGNIDGSDQVFSYFQCCVCPVKLTKSLLSYRAAENQFHNCEPDWIIAPPELGFTFPAFDDRSTNLYNALFYTHDAADSHDDFVSAVFNTDAPMPAEAQKQTFRAVLGNALDEDCSLQVVQTVHEQLSQMIEMHKESRAEDPLTISKNEVRSVLESCSVPESRVAAFSVKFDEEFGSDAGLSPRNIIDHKKFEITTPDIVIHVNPERTDLLKTRTIGGVKYIMICADEAVEVNGVSIHIGGDE